MAASARFVRHAHQLCRDLLRPNPTRYWIDFGVTILLAWASLAIVLFTPQFGAVRAVAFVVCGLAIYRAVVFTHEIVHRPQGSFRMFAVAWNVCCGIPFLMPSFLYGDHKGHHSNEAYGTWADPEYLLRRSQWRPRVVLFLLLPLVYPIGLVIRFLALTPLAALSRRLDRIVWIHMSSLYVMNESYRREYDALATTRSRWMQEVACAAWVWTLVGLTVTGLVSLTSLVTIYFVFVFWMSVNQVRTLAAHRYARTGDEASSYVDQVLDTNTFSHGRFLPDIWAPLGMRYHALHHLLPAMPYHAMGAAHRRLIEALPADSPYHQTLRPGLWPVLVAMMRHRNPDRPGCHR